MILSRVIRKNLLMMILYDDREKTSTWTLFYNFPLNSREGLLSSFRIPYDTSTLPSIPTHPPFHNEARHRNHHPLPLRNRVIRPIDADARRERRRLVRRRLDHDRLRRTGGGGGGRSRLGPIGDVRHVRIVKTLCGIRMIEEGGGGIHERLGV